MGLWGAGVVYYDVRRVGGGRRGGGGRGRRRRGRALAGASPAGVGAAHASVVPLYGPHWDAGAHRDLDLLDVESGECRTVLTAEAVREAYPELIREEFGALAERPGQPLSIFFPPSARTSPASSSKLARPGGSFRSAWACKRAMLVCYDLRAGRLLFADRKWGTRPGTRTRRPSWTSRTS